MTQGFTVELFVEALKVVGSNGLALFVLLRAGLGLRIGKAVFYSKSGVGLPVQSLWYTLKTMCINLHGRRLVELTKRG